jgi:magnesium transporter
MALFRTVGMFYFGQIHRSTARNCRYSIAPLVWQSYKGLQTSRRLSTRRLSTNRIQPDDADIDDWAFDGSRKIGLDISCTILDTHGKVVAVSKKFPRKRFLLENGLHPRDLRNIDSAKVRLIPSILVRKDCILVSLLDLRAAIKHNQVLIFDSMDKSVTSKLSLLVYDLENKLRRHSRPDHDDGTDGFAVSQAYEFKALESILMNAVSSLDIELKSQLKALNSILVDLEDHVDRDLLQELLVRNKAMAKFYQKSLLVRNVISDVLDSDEDLVHLYLSERHTGKLRDLTDHAEAELLLEAYYKQCDEIVQQSEQLISNVKSTEEIINIMLDANRNSLMLLELKITIGTLGFTIGMFFAALYGMNLKNFYEESDIGFVGVSVVIAALSMGVTWYNLRTLSTLKRMSMLTYGDRPYLQRRKQLWKFLSWNRKKWNHYDQQGRAVMWRWLVEKRER